MWARSKLDSVIAVETTHYGSLQLLENKRQVSARLAERIALAHTAHVPPPPPRFMVEVKGSLRASSYASLLTEINLKIKDKWLLFASLILTKACSSVGLCW